MARPALKLLSGTNSKDLSDEAIWELAQADRDSAFDQLVRKYRDRIYYHALYICKDSEEAFDVAQDVFVKAYHEARLFDAGFKVRAWLFRVCTNRCYNIVRDRHRRRGILERVGKQTGLLAEHHQAIDGVLSKELGVGMGLAMEALSPEHRTILLLRYSHDLSYQEIADTLQVKLGTVMSRLSRAKVRLQKILEEQGEMLP